MADSKIMQTKDITSLIEIIRNEIIDGKQNIEKTIDSEKTKTYWNIGRHIHEHLLEHADRAEYGDYLFKELAKDLTIGIRTLYKAVQFYEEYPRLCTQCVHNWNGVTIVVFSPFLLTFIH